MKKKYIYLIVIFLMLSFTRTYDAKCSDPTINAEANKITFRSQGAFADSYGNTDSVIVYVEEIPDDFFLIVTNTNTGEKNTYKFTNVGYVAFKTPTPTEIYRYEIKIYSSSSECENELIRTEIFDSKVFNVWSLSDQCAKLKESILLENEYFDACEYFANKKYDEKEFEKIIEERIKRAEKLPIGEELKIRFYKYYYFALIPMGVLGAYYIIKLIKIKKRKKAQDEE